MSEGNAAASFVEFRAAACKARLRSSNVEDESFPDFELPGSEDMLVVVVASVVVKNELPQL